MSVIEIMLAGLGLVGQTLVSNGNRQGFMVWLVGSLIAIPFFFSQGLYILAMQQGVNSLLNIYSLIRNNPIKQAA